MRIALASEFAPARSGAYSNPQTTSGGSRTLSLARGHPGLGRVPTNPYAKTIAFKSAVTTESSMTTSPGYGYEREDESSWKIREGSAEGFPAVQEHAYEMVPPDSGKAGRFGTHAV